MRKIASPQELVQELRSILASTAEVNPSRAQLAHRLRGLADRVAVEVGIGEKGVGLSWQDEFPMVTECVKCSGEARLALVVREKDEPFEYVVGLHRNDPKDGGFWLHDAGAFATYLCKDIDCATATTLWNQA